MGIECSFNIYILFMFSIKTLFSLAVGYFINLVVLLVYSAQSYPIFAQQNYKTPREANGRIVCANCHLAQKPVELDVPQAVLPDTVFEAVVQIPYDLQTKQVLGNGKSGQLNVGAVLILPSGFRLAPPERIPREIKRRVGNLYFQPYSADQENILVVIVVVGKYIRMDLRVIILSLLPLRLV